MSIRLGAGVPFGKATDQPGDGQTARYSSQFATEIALGAKLSAPIYLGGYAGLWTGAEGDDVYTGGLCNGGSLHDVDCNTESTRLGLEIQYHFIPDGLVNPWLGYGLAYEWAQENIDDHIGQRTERSSVEGMQYGRFQGGIDFRFGKVFGLGLYLQSEIGRYTRATTEINGQETHSGGIDRTAIHGWFGSGVRMVFFP
ncbi:MAG: hypothetical protein U0263_42205 [Polyangiaceae bacterium]